VTKASLRRYQRGLQDGPDLHCRETEELTFFPPQAPSLEQQYPPLHPSASLVVPRLCEPWRCPPRALSLARRAMLLSLAIAAVSSPPPDRSRAWKFRGLRACGNDGAPREKSRRRERITALSSRFHLIRVDGEADERTATETRRDRNIGRIPPVGHQNTPDPRRVVARIKGVPSAPRYTSNQALKSIGYGTGGIPMSPR
jgi:hypothetical protein